MSTGSSEWRNFVRRHWHAVATFVVAGALAFVGAIYVFLWFVGSAQSSGMVPVTLGLWTMGNLANFILYAIFWELLLIGVPAAIGVVVGWQWWKRLPDEERRGYHFGGRSRSAGGGGGASLLFFIAFCIKVFVDGRWNVAIATFTLNYVVDSMITILVWGLIILGIPIAIGLTWWISREMKKP
jgi:hypothetical protein